MATQDIVLQPGQQIKPTISNEIVTELLQRLFHLEADTIKEQNSYDDRNFYVTVKGNSQPPFPGDHSPHGYILKIINSLDSQQERFLNAQIKMMVYLNENGINCPKPVKNVNNSYNSFERFGGESTYCVRLLTFIPGTLVNQVDYTAQILYQVGDLVARTDLALMKFDDSDIRTNRIWNMSSVPQVSQFLYAVTDPERRALAQQVIDQFNAVVVPTYDQLVRGAIHGDMNEQNILVAHDGDGRPRVSGLIDFGDIQSNYYVFELALTCMYMMLDCKTMDPLDAPAHVLAGYASQRPIPAHEFRLLKWLIAARFVQSLVLGAYSFLQHPDPYVLITSKRGWDCLEQLWNCPIDQLYQRWNQIMASYETAVQ